MVPLGVIRPIWLPLTPANQTLPSGPAVISPGPPLAVGTGNSVMVPLGVMRPILLPLASVNQRLPSGPAVIPAPYCPSNALLDAGRENSVVVPLVVMRPILLLPLSVNQRLLSGPAVIPRGSLLAVGMGNSVIVPLSCF